MPELPEVETVRRGLQPAMEGRRILLAETRRPDLRFSFPERFAERLTGARVERMSRRAKYLVAELSSGETLIMHLGMSGRFTVSEKALDIFVHETGADPKHDHVLLKMEGGADVVFNDPRRFGFMELWPTDNMSKYPRFLGMGPEPLSNGFSVSTLSTALEGRRTPIKAALLDQSVVAGLGNIYVCEALFRAGISPRRLSLTIPGKRAERLVPAIRDVLVEAVEAGGSSISDYARADGSMGYFQHNFAVYGREGRDCGVCGTDIRRLVQSGRSTFYCGRCQR
ncbi:MAG: bifunctional DNA-formamidopyrimidine glycosylase/DNA-(apurinic or apyrimidinic site) lyase [Pseudomonadota bacterium]